MNFKICDNFDRKTDVVFKISRVCKHAHFVHPLSYNTWVVLAPQLLDGNYSPACSQQMANFTLVSYFHNRKVLIDCFPVLLFCLALLQLLTVILKNIECYI